MVDGRMDEMNEGKKNGQTDVTSARNNNSSSSLRLNELKKEGQIRHKDSSKHFGSSSSSCGGSDGFNTIKNT